ncbi:hypothetical protein CEUSTIGMA_g2888.t1 [Chlamydomonas eustigma]|uniref:Peptidase M11 gametolysin domain-containing protein n=1 Tax=Chlamydomonas eustigma TaxID=1157962 RepID=A0A250WX83_9CHLO|nr:hypothetical protein CEUSTIGMA_g2888.t1 [Chlamydomonas eustigma]|eukprot:GAX75444.1 hypothetical protein CEUSTIGMA_g2888.t1 [Chlamydomonas eustigma]
MYSACIFCQMIFLAMIVYAAAGTSASNLDFVSMNYTCDLKGRLLCFTGNRGGDHGAEGMALAVESKFSVQKKLYTLELIELHQWRKYYHLCNDEVDLEYYTVDRRTCTDFPMGESIRVTKIQKGARVTEYLDRSTLKRSLKGQGTSMSSESTLFLILDWSSCQPNAGPATNAMALHNQLLDVSSPSSLSSCFTACSNQQAYLNSSNSLVASGTVPMQCNGTTPQYTWTLYTCGGDQMLGWLDFASRYAQSSLNIDITQFMRRVLILPRSAANWQYPGQQCLFAGMTAIGGAFDYVNNMNYEASLIIGEASSDVSIFFHELGHGMGLIGHAATPPCLTCDVTSAMGANQGGANLCYNGQENYQLGWAKPVAEINVSTLQPDVGLSVYVPDQLTTSQNVLLVHGAGPGTLYITRRSNVNPLDVPLDQSALQGATSVHIANQSTLGSVILATLQNTSSSWQDSASGLIISNQLSASQQVQVLLCIPGASNTCASSQQQVQAPGGTLPSSPPYFLSPPPPSPLGIPPPLARSPPTVMSQKTRPPSPLPPTPPAQSYDPQYLAFLAQFGIPLAPMPPNLPRSPQQQGKK